MKRAQLQEVRESMQDIDNSATRLTIDKFLSSKIKLWLCDILEFFSLGWKKQFK